MSAHFRKDCVCGRLLTQCRCPAQDKQRIVVAPCQHRPPEVTETVYDPSSGTIAQDAASANPAAVDVEILERGGPAKPAAGPASLLVPTEVRLNGQPVYTSAEHPVVVNQVDVGGAASAVYVTLTLLARRVRIDHEPSVD